MNQSTDDFVIQIHSVLAVRYGAGWARMWQGLEMEFVRADWRRVLREFEANPVAVAYALDNLPVGARPPTAGEFLQLCQAAPRPAVRMLPRSGSRPSPEQLRVMAMVKERAHLSAGAARARARDNWQGVLERVAAGEPVTPTIRKWAMEQARSMREVVGGQAVSTSGTPL